MQPYICDKSVVARWVGSLCLIFSVTQVLADEAYYYPQQQHVDDVNPWLAQPRYRQPTNNYRSQQQPRRTDNRTYNGGYSRDRFVTPEILESLKRQQSQYQVMPENRYHKQVSPGPMLPNAGPPPVRMTDPGSSFYGVTPYGMGMTNPLYDAPAVSPWGSLPDMLYQGETMPVVPDAAIGGIAPLDTPLFGRDAIDPLKALPGGPELPQLKRNGMYDEEQYGPGRYKDNLFNPFTFLPDVRLY